MKSPAEKSFTKIIIKIFHKSQSLRLLLVWGQSAMDGVMWGQSYSRRRRTRDVRRAAGHADRARLGQAEPATGG